MKAGVFLPLDASKLPNLVNMDADIMQRVARYDPANAHSITYLWGTTGIGYNPDSVEKALGTRRIDSWSTLFDPSVAAKLARCGIAMVDSPDNVLGVARIQMGLDTNSEKLDDLAAAARLVTDVRPYVRNFDSSHYHNDLASGEICVALGWSGDVMLARARGAAASPPVEVDYAVPKEGTIIGFSLVAIPADAPHPVNAHAFLNYLMEPEVIARVSNEIRYANANAAALPLLDAGLRNDPDFNPGDSVRARLHQLTVKTPDFSREQNRTWTRIKSGQ